MIIDQGLLIRYDGEHKPVLNAIDILRRDIAKICQGSLSTHALELVEDPAMEAESYRLEIEEQGGVLKASDELGFIYGLLFISQEFLGIKPFWFWMEQKLPQLQSIRVSERICDSEKKRVRFRGWFFNDEVLLMGWPHNQKTQEGWKMGFEALLRCGGNMVIPGTDKMSRDNKQLASDYGLWITHHHAEPLGAEMFARAYPDLQADYFQHPELFEKLWEEAVLEQKDMKVVWNLCFRGQGDCPFWLSGNAADYDTDEKRGKVISDLICKQADIVRKYVKEPVFCTNLYGEIMELYEKGFVSFPEGVILVKADNGFGKMVTRRRGNHNPRVNSIPDPKEKRGQGIYYHVSFYDLQAANHVTMLPNSVNFVRDELQSVLKNGGDDFWVINCSNVKPHCYFLDAVSRIWNGHSVDNEKQAVLFTLDYFGPSVVSEKATLIDHGFRRTENPEKVPAALESEELRIRLKTIMDAYREYSAIAPAFGIHEDEHAGEQFYTENLRYFAHYALLGQKETIRELTWLTDEKDYAQQLNVFQTLCKDKLEIQKNYLTKVPDEAVTLKLQARMHYESNLGVQSFYEGYQALQQKDYIQAFYCFGQSAERFEDIDTRMKASTVGIWQGFYDNDAQADFKFTAYLIRKLMGYVRELGDNSEHYRWQHDFTYAPEDRKVVLLLLTSNHSTDEELYQALKQMKSSDCEVKE